MIPHLDRTFKERGGSGRTNAKKLGKVCFGKTFKQLSEGDRVSGQNIKFAVAKRLSKGLMT